MQREHSLQNHITRMLHGLDAKFGVDRALLFGSAARGSRLDDSDVDIIVVSKRFEGLSIPARQAAIQKEWSHETELQALTYTPSEFVEVTKRLTMQEILSYAVDVTPARGWSVCPKCGRRGSLQTKIITNRLGKSYPYHYYAHYEGGKVKWCYVGAARRLLEGTRSSPPLRQSPGLKRKSS